MPVQIQSVSFTDQFGNTTPSYKANAGDRITMSIILLTNIRISSLTNPMILDPSINTVTLSTGSWLEEGFRVGDTVVFTLYSSGGSVISTWNATSSYVSDTVLDVDSIPVWYDISVGEFIVIEVPSKAGRGDLEVNFNHVSNTNGGSEFSLIDGEVTKGVFPNTNAMAVGGSFVSAVGNKSGQYVYNFTLTRQATSVTNSKQFKLDIDFIQSGIYDQSWFSASDCLKTFVKFSWSRDANDVNNLFKITYSPGANTGWFNEGYNLNIIDSSVVQGISSIDYGVASTHTIIVDGPLTDIGIGASYIPTNEAYYKNKVNRQTGLGMVAFTRDLSVTSQPSQSNPSGAQYTITINSVVVSGTQTIIDLTFTPNANFKTFMDSVDEGDRLFYVWVKCGNVNHLVYADQLVYTPPPGAPLVLDTEITYYDHGQNVNDGLGSGFTTEFNTEDDLALWGTFLLDKNTIYDSFVARIEAYNSTTQDDFTLLQATFDFSGVQISSDGRYLLNEVIAINTILPQTNLKKEAKLYLYPSLDTSTQYGVAIYFPFLLRWEYWLEQLNASVDFYPNQNKNWFQYDNAAPWEVQCELQLNEPTTSHLYSKEIVINDYDSEIDLQNDIELKIESTSQVVGVVVENEIMRVTATHEILNAYVWDPTKIWGHITVEPFEGAPRWMVSSVVPTDGNVLNPLSPISGTLVQITYPSAKIAKMECFFDPSKLNLENGCKFTSKIKGCQAEPVKTMTTGTTKTTTDGTDKTLAL